MRKNAVVVKAGEINAKWLQCDKKVKYTKKDALVMARAIAKSGRVERMGIYPCDYCQGWHLTHIKKGEL